jgi:DNA-binding beta-propeller fold protein YncE
MSNRVLIAAFAVLLGCSSLQAQEILVASSRSNSIERFTTAGTWVGTFATTGPYAPIAMAQSPVTGEIFVTTEWTGTLFGNVSNVILRYQPNGQFDTNWDTFRITCGACVQNATGGLLFDHSGNLWVATRYGLDTGGPIYVQEYPESRLALPNPGPLPSPILANLNREDQMAFDTSGNLCLTSFIDEDVQCFDTATGKLVRDYRSEILAAGLAIEPAGLAFDTLNRLYLTSIFTGEVVREVTPGGPIVKLATLTSSPNQLNGNLVWWGGNLFTTSYNIDPPTADTPDAVYEVSTSGTVTKLITGGVPPTLGNDHLWGAYWLIFTP